MGELELAGDKNYYEENHRQKAIERLKQKVSYNISDNKALL
ncbi:MAG: hypothetical protein WB443_02590 [Nitrososphaeraceae archaeon]|jgi:hypothetical protein